MNEKDTFSTEQENLVVPITRFRRSRRNKERRYSAFIIAQCHKLTNEILSREKGKERKVLFQQDNKLEPKPEKKTEIECGWFGHASWSANPNDENLPFEYCKDCLKQKECRNKDLGNQEEAAIESAYEQMYGQEEDKS